MKMNPNEDDPAKILNTKNIPLKNTKEVTKAQIIAEKVKVKVEVEVEVQNAEKVAHLKSGDEVKVQIIVNKIANKIAIGETIVDQVAAIIDSKKISHQNPNFKLWVSKINENCFGKAKKKEQVAETTNQAETANFWKNSSFENEDRKEKFLSLMGAKKAKPPPAESYNPDAPTTPERERFEESQMFRDLENQFYQGLSRKQKNTLGLGL